MSISAGDTLPEATLSRMGAEGVETVTLSDRLKGRKVVIFGIPGAFSGTCQVEHVPSFIRTKDALAEKGVEEIICIAVNDPFVMKAFAEATGADEAGLTMLCDADSAFSKAIGMELTVPAIGFFSRSKRYAMLVEDGTVTRFLPEQTRGCETSAGEALLAAM